MSMIQISVFLENKAGTLNQMTKVLADGGVDLRALSVAEAKDFGIARIIVDDSYAAGEVLREAQYIFTLTPVIACEVPDTAGGLNRLLTVFTEESINIEYMYSCLIGLDKQTAYMILRVENAATAEARLLSRGVRLLTQDSSALN